MMLAKEVPYWSRPQNLIEIEQVMMRFVIEYELEYKLDARRKMQISEECEAFAKTCIMLISE